MGKSGNALFKRTAPIEPKVVDDQTSLELIESKPPEYSSVKPLSKNEKKRLVDLEEIVTRNFKAFYDVGCALREIQQRKLYRETHSTFANYAHDLWDLARRRAYQFIEAADVVDNVKNFTQNLPTNDSQARVLSKYPADKQVDLWRRAIHELPTNGKMTASHIRKMADLIGLEKVKKIIVKSKKRANRSPKINEDFRKSFQNFLDQINIERSKKWKDTDRTEAIRAIRDILEALEAEV